MNILFPVILEQSGKSKENSFATIYERNDQLTHIFQQLHTINLIITVFKRPGNCVPRNIVETITKVWNSFFGKVWKLYNSKHMKHLINIQNPSNNKNFGNNNNIHEVYAMTN